MKVLLISQDEDGKSVERYIHHLKPSGMAGGTEYVGGRIRHEVGNTSMYTNLSQLPPTIWVSAFTWPKHLVKILESDKSSDFVEG